MERPVWAQTSTMIWNEAIVEQDAKLNVVYKKLMAAIPSAAQRENLKAAQRAWLDWLVKEEWMVFMLQNQRSGLSAKHDLIVARIKQLEDLLRDRESFSGRK
jgi:uncharacterized protein YecT (DUF1311 family)